MNRSDLSSGKSLYATDRSVRIYVGIGSNMNAETNVAMALELMKKQFGSLDVSRPYLNPAQGFVGDDFINLVVGFSYQGAIRCLKDGLREIERQCGREREKESGMNSRPMDLDLLTFGDLEGIYEGVSLPRSDVYDRDFVRKPLLQLLQKRNDLSEFEVRLIDLIGSRPRD